MTVDLRWYCFYTITMAKKINLNNIEAFAKKNAVAADRRAAQAENEARMRKEQEKKDRERRKNRIDPFLAFLIADAILHKNNPK